MKIIVAFALGLAAMPTFAATIVVYDAASGLLPEASPSRWSRELDGTASVASGVLTLDGRVQYYQDATTTPGIDTQRPFALTTSYRYVAGTTSNDSREGARIGFIQGASTGGALSFGAGRIFLADGNLLRGATAALDTTVNHLYRLDIGAPDVVTGFATIDVAVDGIATLHGSTFTSTPFFGTTPNAVFFGGGSFLASATSEWTYVNAAAVPEPASWVLLVAGFAATGVMRRRRVVAG